jgi:PKD repeat protein
MRRILALLLILALGFSGCLGLGGEAPGNGDGAGKDASGPAPEAPADEGDPGAGEGSAPPQNRAPSAAVVADVATGTAPLNVTFTIEGFDPDGDGLNWTLDFGDDSEGATGSTLPTTITHLYPAGDHTAVLTVTDGALTTTAEAAMNVTAAPDLPNAAQTGTNVLCLDYLVLFNLDGTHAPAAESERVEVEAGSSYTITADEGVPLIDFYDADGAYLSTHEAEGEVPGGAAYGYVCVTTTGMYPDVPVPLGEFTYQDGF